MKTDGTQPAPDPHDREALLAENERLRRLVDARTDGRLGELASQFLARVSHELRTPLTAILGFTDLMLEDGNLAEAPSFRVEHLHTIKRNSQHLLRILDDVLDFSRVDGDGLEVETVAFATRELIDDVARLLRPSALQKRIGFDLRLKEPLPRTLRSDPTRLRQILINLIGNAIKFTEQGGVIVELEVCDSAAPEPGRVLCFHVRDSGPGVEPAAQERIFEPYTQANATIARSHGGTGLGLSIARRLADLLGGSLALESEPGEGSTFTLRLPIEPRTQLVHLDDRPEDEEENLSTRAFLSHARGSTKGARVLVADDDPDSRRLVTVILMQVGLKVTPAGGGGEALAAARAAAESGEPYDLIVLDMRMPGLDGYETARQMRAASCESPILALTANALRLDRERCLEAGCDDYATKPIDRRELTRQIQRLLDAAEGGPLVE